MQQRARKGGWKGPTVQEIADLARVGPATVDRVLNDRPNVRDKTRRRVLEARNKLIADAAPGAGRLDLRLFCESGETFNSAMALAVTNVNRSMPGVTVKGRYVMTKQLDPPAFSRAIEEEGQGSDGVIVVAHEHPAINRAIRALVASGTLVVCLTSDLPSSRRSAYVGNDQYAAGSVAASLIGRALPQSKNRILLVMSMPFRSQQEREMGFRRALRADFPHLRIDDRVIHDDDPSTTYELIMRYIEASDVPAAIYNIAGANRGIATALEKAGCARRTIFTGHELTARSRELLESGTMDYVISHDFTAELAAAATWIADTRAGRQSEPWISPILVHTKYNCAL